VANLLGYALTVVLLRGLPVAEFGALAALLGAGAVASVTMTALQLEVARTTSHNPLPPRELHTLAAAVSGGTGLLALVLAPVLVPLLRLDDPRDAVLLAVLLVPQTYVGALLGVLLGDRLFVPFAILLLVAAGSRLVAAVVAMSSSLGSTGFLGLSVVLGAAVVLLGLGLVARAGERAPSTPEPRAWRTCLPGLRRAAAGGGALLLLVNLDLLLARAVLDDAASGWYAYLTIFARVCFWGTNFLSLWVFPLVAGREASTTAVHGAFGAVVAIGVLAVVGALVLHRPVTAMVAGSAYGPVSYLAPLFAAAGAFLSLLQLATYVDIAGGHRAVTLTAWAAAVAMTAGVAVLQPSSVTGVAVIDVVVLAGAALVATWLALRRSTAGQAPPPLLRRGPSR
jgi:O-antigen/teichoic acid export membrane protein